MKELSLKTKFVAVVVLVLLTIVGIYLWKGYNTKDSKVSANSTIESNLKVYTLEQIAQYDGTDSNKPIYLVYEGKVYDVSSGREYYNSEGSYHYLAGTDATSELKIFGGDIIKRKYPVIGIVE